jgi:ferredoxin, 2Fe-2S
MIVKEGMDNLSPLTGPEDFFREKGRLNTTERLTCQASIEKGVILIRVAEENKFSHMVYNE